MLLRNSALNFLSLAIPLLLGIFTVPQIISGLGLERFGALTLMWALIGYAGIFDLGIARALTKRVAELGDDAKQIRPVVGVGLSILVSLGLTIGAVLLMGSSLIGFEAFSIPPDELFFSVVLLALSVPFVMLGGGFRGVLEGVHRFSAVAAVRLCFGLITFGAPALMVSLTPRLDVIVSMMMLGRVIGCVGLAYACRDYFPRKLPSAHQQLVEAKKMLHFGGWITLSNVISPVMVYMDRFFLAASPFAGLLAFYTTPYEFVTKLFIVPSALTSVLFPRVVKDVCLEKNDKKLLILGCAGTLLSLTPIAAALSLFGDEILGWWISSDFAANASIPLKILAAGVLVNSLAQVFQTYLLGHGYAYWMARLHVVELIIYLPVLYFLLGRFGIDGVAMVWTLRVSLDAILLARKADSLSYFSSRDSLWMLVVALLAGVAMVLGSKMSLISRVIIWCAIGLVTTGLSFWRFRKRFNRGIRLIGGK